MSKDLKNDIGETLCAACAASKKAAHQGTVDQAQAALKVATDEMGDLPHRETCPNGGSGEPGCPLMRHAL
ncbi:hypothetical protein R3X27_06955 [Tropicimonas sp. TH_r6]|uniref:hypothetical protein n=1 Tax=Tropicimonas sp. TH_r6 TaxID=3082085 RepID=UPI002952A218|nr:hypothetical protein [Tropicimonas sp. TH_r6]MDV7142418.1 hypothetical protein [Tropicimonas sp. TH_r6]